MDVLLWSLPFRNMHLKIGYVNGHEKSAFQSEIPTAPISVNKQANYQYISSISEMTWLCEAA